MFFPIKLFIAVLKSDLLAPILLIAVYIFFLVVLRGVIPAPEELITEFGALYRKYGYEIIIISAILESSIIINMFVPGSLALAMGAIFASRGELDLMAAILAASLGLLIGYTLDFALGYFGFSDVIRKFGYKDFLETARRQLLNLGTKGLVLGFINPTVASFMSLAAGTSGLRFRKFFIVSVISTFVWVPLWALLFYFLGEVLVEIFLRYWLLAVLIVIVGIFVLRLGVRKIKYVRS